MYVLTRLAFMLTIVALLAACGRSDAPAAIDPTSESAPTMLPTTAPAAPTPYPEPTIAPDQSLSYPAPTIGPETNTPYPAPAMSLTGGTWRLVNYGRGGMEDSVIDGSEITLMFQADGKIAGSAGCNSYFGSYTVNGETLTISQMGATLKACVEENLMEQERVYLSALEAAERYIFEEDRLIIQYDGLQSSLTFEPVR
jgi:heat shock protein HslJ